jgi:NTP pyrophosphatase (non-canonical NTP hydrolase)
MGDVHISVSTPDGAPLGAWRTDGEGQHHSAAGLTFARLSEVNRSRRDRWHVDPDQLWSGLEWAGAMCGEAGEAANVTKKLRRLETGVVLGVYDTLSPDQLVEKLAKELADTIIYADLVAAHYGIDLPAAIVAKFNEKSVEQGFPERLP